MSRRLIKLTDKDKAFLKPFDTKGFSIKQKKFLVTFRAKMGNVSQTCKVVGISRSRYYQWLDELDTFKIACEEVLNGLYDDVESIMYEKVFVQKDTTMLIWLSKTKMRDRGYVENMEHSIKKIAPLEVKVE